MGDYLSKPNTEKHTELNENGKMRYSATGMQGWRRSMEDSHIANLDIGDEVSCFGVFDGHGGSEVALFVKKHFIPELKKLESFKKKDYRKALEEVFLKMDVVMLSKEGQKELTKIITQNNANDSLHGGDPMLNASNSQAGCTATVILVTKTEIICANAGDSRTVASVKGKAIDLSMDHKPDLPSEKSRITRAGGFVEESRVDGMLALSRALGDFEYKDKSKISNPKEYKVTAFPEIRTQKLSGDVDFIVLACDGIWDCMESQECVTYIKEKLNSKAVQQDFKKCTEDLLDKIVAKDVTMSQGIGCDNMTITIVEFKR